MTSTFPTGSPNRGSVLLLCLLLLTALSLLGAAAGASAVMQERMASNHVSRAQARQAVAFSLRWAEAWLYGQAGSPRPLPCPADCGGVINSPEHFSIDAESRSAAWWASTAFSAGADPLTGEEIAAWPTGDGDTPRWMIEEIHHEEVILEGVKYDVSYYRILARATGPMGRGVSVAESIVARPWGEAIPSALFPPDPAGGAFCDGVPDELGCGRLAWNQRR